ncbi:MAG TPA: hypothetical protein VGL89_09010 [Candidatus Koribacter sp.]|jgi:hypothetical protein
MAEKKYSIWPAIVVLVVAFGVPTAIGTIEVRIARNAHAESAAIQQMEAIVKAENAYHAEHQSYSATLDAIRDLPKPENYYAYHYMFLSPDKYAATAQPNYPGKYGRRYFYTDQTGEVRYEVMKEAGAGSEAVPEKK